MLRSKIQAREFMTPSEVLDACPVVLTKNSKGEIVEVVTSNFSWVIAMVWSGYQQRVARDLRDAGFSPYAPFGSRFANRTVGRSSGLERRVRCVVRYPVFGSYMFVGHATKLAGRSTHMRIASVLGDAEGPALISPSAIRATAQYEINGEWDNAGPKARITPAYYEGQEIKIKEGPFAGFFGIVRGLRGELRYKIEASIFGRPTKMTIEAAQIEAV